MKVSSLFVAVLCCCNRNSRRSVRSVRRT